MKLSKLMTFGIFAALALFLASCASTAYVEKDESVNFNNYQTFAWMDKNDKEKASSITEQNIKRAVKMELEKAGWREVKNRPDILLSYDVLIERAVREENNPVYSRPFTRVYYNPYTRRYGTLYYPSQFMGYENNQTSVREGTITITMIDARTDKTIWQGWTTEEVNSRNLTSKEIQNSVRSIFRKFDVAKK